jgi:hypothetical protein
MVQNTFGELYSLRRCLASAARSTGMPSNLYSPATSARTRKKKKKKKKKEKKKKKKKKKKRLIAPWQY